MTANPIIPVIDYTSRDYEAVRADMIRLIRQRVPEWGAEDPNDFGVALVEAYAYAVDQLHYYLDRVANEAYLGTAVQRESVLAIAAMFGYRPYDASPAMVEVVFGNSTDRDVIIPAGARVQATLSNADETIIRSFETISELVVGAKTEIELDNPAGVLAVEGRTYYNEQIGISNGTPFQRMFLPRTSVLHDTVQVYVVLGEATAEYQRVNDLETASDDDRAFILEAQADGSTAIIFGDSYNGEIPALHGVVRATYRVGGGNLQVPPNTLTTLVEPLLPGITVTNPGPASGGRDRESLESVRINAVRQFRTPAPRAVTLEDFAGLAKSYPGVTKAKAVANNGVSVTVYAGMTSGYPHEPRYDDLAIYASYNHLHQEHRTYSDLYHRYPDDIVLAPEKALDLQQYLQGLAMAGVTVTVIGPLWVQVYVHLTVQCKPSAVQSDVERAVRSRLRAFFSYANVNFDNRLTNYDINTLLQGIPGVEYINVEGFGTDASSLSTSPIHFIDLGVNVIPWWDDLEGTSNPSLILDIAGGR